MISQDRIERFRAAYDNFGTDGLALDLMTDDIEFKQPTRSVVARASTTAATGCRG